jgi:hypothetical protein
MKFFACMDRQTAGQYVAKNGSVTVVVTFLVNEEYAH